MNAAPATPTPAATAWARHLAGTACHEPGAHGEHGEHGAHGAPGVREGLPQDTAAQPAPALSMAEAQRVQRYRDRLMAAVRSQDRSALRSAKQEVLQAAFRGAADTDLASAGSSAMRRALRDLCWRMAILMLPRQREG